MTKIVVARSGEEAKVEVKVEAQKTEWAMWGGRRPALSFQEYALQGLRAGRERLTGGAHVSSL